MSEFDLIGLAGTLIGLIGIVMALWQAKKNRSLREYLKVEAIGDYHRASIVFGCADLCLKALQRDDISVAIQEAGKAQGAAQTIWARSVENLQHHYRYTLKDIDEWIQRGRIAEHEGRDFRKYAEK
jgi:hypothetical protein